MQCQTLVGIKGKPKMSPYPSRSNSSLPFRGVFAFYLAGKIQATECSPPHLFSSQHLYLPTYCGFPSVIINSLYYSLRENSPLRYRSCSSLYSRMFFEKFPSIPPISVRFFFSWIISTNIQTCQYLSYLKKKNFSDPKSIVLP